MLIGVVLLSGAVQSGAAGGATAKPHRGGPAARTFLDARTAGSSGRLLRARATTLATSPSIAVTKLGHQLGLQGAISIDPLTGTPRMVGRLDGFLTGPSSARARSPWPVRGHVAAMGLGLRASTAVDGGAAAGAQLRRRRRDDHVGWEQTLHGTSRSSGGPPGQRLPAWGGSSTLTGSPVERDHRDDATRRRVNAARGGADAARADVDRRGAPHLDSAKLVLFSDGRGEQRLAWQSAAVSLARDLRRDRCPDRAVVLSVKSRIDFAYGSVVPTTVRAPPLGACSPQHVADPFTCRPARHPVR